MGHRSILMRMKVHYELKYLYRLRIFILQYLTKKKSFKTCLKGKHYKIPSGFEPMTYISVGNPLTHSSLLLGSNFRKETMYKIMLDFIVFFR